jgi:hypothetical protein
LVRFGGTAARAAIATTAVRAAREETRIHELLLRTDILLLGALTGCDRAGLELDFAILGG